MTAKAISRVIVREAFQEVEEMKRRVRNGDQISDPDAFVSHEEIRRKIGKAWRLPSPAPRRTSYLELLTQAIEDLKNDNTVPNELVDDVIRLALYRLYRKDNRHAQDLNRVWRPEWQRVEAEIFSAKNALLDWQTITKREDQKAGAFFLAAIGRDDWQDKRRRGLD